MMIKKAKIVRFEQIRLLKKNKRICSQLTLLTWEVFLLLYEDKTGKIIRACMNVLDNFDAICSDLKIGLPAEIEARKKQYEYYRDKLLAFKRSGNR